MVLYGSSLVLFATFITSSLSASVPTTSGYSPELLAKARQGLYQAATHSWELGTETEALLESEWTRLSVANPNIFPLPATLAPGEAADVLSIVQKVVSQIPPNATTLIDGDGAAGDPASLGMGVLLANWTRSDKSDQSYSIAAYNQLEHLLVNVPRAPNGAISHRESEAQLWADFVYMVPPFLAYYGAIQNNATLLTEAYNQCKTYREVLSDGSGLWQHILLGSWSDTRHWGTGNGWAATGMLRVLQTLKASKLSHQFVKEQADLASWVSEILVATWPHQAANGTLYNVIDDNTTFADATGTAMLASATYRLASLTGIPALIPYAEKAYELVVASTDSDGWLTQAVDPLTFDTPVQPGGHTPEGQAFILIVEAARSEYIKKKGWWKL